MNEIQWNKFIWLAYLNKTCGLDCYLKNCLAFRLACTRILIRTVWIYDRKPWLKLALARTIFGTQFEENSRTRALQFLCWTRMDMLSRMNASTSRWRLILKIFNLALNRLILFLKLILSLPVIIAHLIMTFRARIRKLSDACLFLNLFLNFFRLASLKWKIINN